MRKLIGFLVIFVLIGFSQELSRKRIEEMFRSLMENSSFDPVKLVGSPWIITYSWNQRYFNTCTEIIFKNVTKNMVERVRKNVGMYLPVQPNWNNAVLKAIVPGSSLGMLLIASSKLPGTMTGIEMRLTRRFRDNYHYYRYAFNLFEDKYLVRLNCDSGIAVLMERKEATRRREETEKFAKTFNFGYGSPACY